MGNKKTEGSTSGSNGTVQCCNCVNFKYFQNDKDHNSPHALGECQVKSWDGNRGQWPMLRHPCSRFDKADQEDMAGVEEGRQYPPGPPVG
jgi:hypothetical protein